MNILFKEYNDVLTVKDLCEALHIGRNKAYEILQSGRLKCIKVGSDYKIPKPYLIEYLTVA